MNKYTPFVVCHKHTASGHIRSEALRIHNSHNLIDIVDALSWANCTIISINACDTWKEAQKIADEWNTTAERNGELYGFWEEG